MLCALSLTNDLLPKDVVVFILQLYYQVLLKGEMQSLRDPRPLNIRYISFSAIHFLIITKHFLLNSLLVKQTIKE